MTKHTKVGVIGCGVIAPTHIGSYQNQDNVEVAWLCDRDEEKARTLAKTYGVANVTTDYRQVLAAVAVDGISVCTDHASHAPICVAALEAGKHVLCEKALAATSEGLDAMLAAHGQHPDLVFSGVFQHRFDAASRLLKRLVDDGVFGSILTAGIQMRCLRTPGYYEADCWRGTWAKEGGSVLINQAIHFIDMLAWLMGGVSSLCGTHDNLTHGDSIETEDTAVASLRFTNGALGTIEATCSSHISWEPNLSIHGTLGSVDVRDGRCVKMVFEDETLGKAIQAEWNAAADGPGVSVGKNYYGSGHPAQIADFVDAMRDNRAPFVGAASARHAVDVVLGIYKSHRQNGWVSV